MKISTKGRYGLRAMVDLAIYSQNKPVSLNTIAHRQEISELYLEQIFALLRKGDLVKSKRGVNGGYYLNKEPQVIQVKEILECLEGDISVVPCLQEANEECPRNQVCPTRILWRRINNAVARTLDSYTLEDLIIEAKYRDDSLPGDLTD